MTPSVMIVCPACAAVNRVPSARLAEAPVCGKCQSTLFAGHPVELDADNFEKHVGRSDIPVVVDFWAPWCAPCRMMAPAFAEAARALEPNVRLCKLDTEEHGELAGRFAIRSIPTLIVFRNGHEIARQSGAMDRGHLIRWIGSHA